MRRLFVLLNVSMLGGLITLGAATLSLLYLMFSSKEDEVSKTGFFGAVSFESVKNTDGSLSVQAGLDNWVPVLIFWAVLSLLLFATYLMYRWLKGYKQRLVEASQRV